MKKYYLLVVYVAFFISCSNQKTENINTIAIDTQTVISIGDVKISAYEFQKNMNGLKARTMQANTISPGQPPVNLKQQFINKIYFLADAYDKGYNKNPHIDSLVEGAARFMISQSNGLLDQEKNNKYIVTNAELKNAIERSKKQLHIEYLKFKDKNALLKNLHGTPPNTAAGFKKLIEEIDLTEVIYNQDTLRWPFNGYWGGEDDIYNLKNGQVSPMLKLHDGYYLIHVNSIDDVSKHVATEDRMKGQLQLAQQKKIKDLYNIKIYNSARAVINHSVVIAFANKLRGYVYGQNHTFIKKDFGDILPATILTYIAPAGQTNNITVNNFIDFYNTLFLKGSIRNYDDVYNNLNAILMSDYAYNDAVKMGINKQPKFLLDRNNFKNNIIFNTYLEQELADKSTITNAEIEKTYELMKPAFAQAENVTASIYYFNNEREALRKKSDIKSDTIKFTGLIKANKHQTINYKSNILPDTLKKEIFSINNPSYPSRMVEINGQFIVVEKENETGKRIRSLQEVRDLVMKEIKSQRLVKNQKAKLSELKNKYVLKIDLTDDRLASQLPTNVYNTKPSIK